MLISPSVSQNIQGGVQLRPWERATANTCCKRVQSFLSTRIQGQDQAVIDLVTANKDQENQRTPSQRTEEEAPALKPHANSELGRG